MNQSINHQSQKTLWQSTGKVFFWLRSLSQAWSHFITLAIFHVRRVVAAGPVALNELATNTRHLIGLGFGMVGGVSIFLHLLFDEAARDLSWYYVNWFYFFFDLRLWFVLIFFSFSFLLCTPAKFKLAVVAYSIPSSAGFIGLIHYSFFVSSFESYHSLPVWYVLMIGAALGFGFCFTINYLCYRKYHLKDGSVARVIGILNTPDVDDATVLRHARTAAGEIENYNSRI